MGFIIRILLFFNFINGNSIFESCPRIQFDLPSEDYSFMHVSECKSINVLTINSQSRLSLDPDNKLAEIVIRLQLLGIEEKYPGQKVWLIFYELLRLCKARFKKRQTKSVDRRRREKSVRYESIRVSQVKQSSALEIRLFTLFQKCFSKKMSLHEFRLLFEGRSDLEFNFMMKNGIDIGIMFFMYVYDQKSDILFIRPGVGIIPEERGQKFPRNLIFQQMLMIKLKRPFQDVVLLSISMSPIAYMQSCEYFRHTYPNPRYRPSKKMLQIKKRSCALFQLNEIREDVVKIHFSFDQSEKTCMTYRPNFYIYHYRHLIKRNEHNMGLMTIIPVSFLNLAGALVKIFINSI